MKIPRVQFHLRTGRWSNRRIVQVAFIVVFIVVYSYWLPRQDSQLDDSINLKASISPGTDIRYITSDLYGSGCRENPYRSRFKTLLRFWEAVAARQNIAEYFLCYGSLLGSARDGDVVPYDYDLDICMFSRDLAKLLPEESKRPFKYDDGEPHLILQRHCRHPRRGTPRLDCDGKIVRKYVDPCSIVYPCGRILLGSPPLNIFAMQDNGGELLDEYKGVRHERSTILPVRSCRLMGIRTKCPHSPASYLTRYYGKDFTTNPTYVCRDRKWVRLAVPQVKSQAEEI